MVAIALIVLVFGLLGLAWHLGGPVPVRPFAISLPTVEVGDSTGQSATMTSDDTRSGKAAG
ncbi:MAG: hypothetical protein KGJ57_01030 [Sphingomonadales bacterium]|nr:hypothetical protein [Sphingomonadales bacterium]MDE2167992.1 hypothetical protein [Sphingomonadales bacterium]